VAANGIVYGAVCASKIAFNFGCLTVVRNTCDLRTPRMTQSLPNKRSAEIGVPKGPTGSVPLVTEC
jgi:hypothetical protein